MKKVDAAFIAKLPLEPRRGRKSELMSLANSLEIGESLFVELEEWKTLGFKSTPTQLIRSSSFQPRALIYRKKFHTEKRKNGWLATRKS